MKYCWFDNERIPDANNTYQWEIEYPANKAYNENIANAGKWLRCGSDYLVDWKDGVGFGRENVFANPKYNAIIHSLYSWMLLNETLAKFSQPPTEEFFCSFSPLFSSRITSFESGFRGKGRRDWELAEFFFAEGTRWSKLMFEACCRRQFALRLRMHFAANRRVGETSSVASDLA